MSRISRKSTNIQLGNNNSGINVILSDNEEIREMQEKIMQLSADIVWAEEQLKFKDLLIDKLIKKLRNA